MVRGAMFCIPQPWFVGAVVSLRALPDVSAHMSALPRRGGILTGMGLFNRNGFNGLNRSRKSQ